MVSDTVGYDAGKKLKGRKRLTLVDTLGLLLMVKVFAANGSWILVAGSLMSFCGLKGAKVLSLFLNPGWLLAKPAKGLRTYCWLHWCRRLNLDYERLPSSSVRGASRSEAFIHIAMIRLMLRRLA